MQFLEQRYTPLPIWKIKPQFIPIFKKFEDHDFEKVCLSRNPNAIQYLEENPMKIEWINLSGNKNGMKIIKNIGRFYYPLLCENTSLEAIQQLEENFTNIDWIRLSTNPAAIHILEANPKKINWKYLCLNHAEGALRLLLANPKKINWFNLSSNPSPIAIKLLEANPEKIDWMMLSANPSAIHIIEKNLDKSDNTYLCMNPNATHLIKETDINWWQLSANPSAIHIIEQNLDKVKCFILQNPNIFELDYQKMSKERTWIILEDLVKMAIHPTRVQKLLDMGLDIDRDEL